MQYDECHRRINVMNGQITNKKDLPHAPDRSVASVQDAMSNKKGNDF